MGEKKALIYALPTSAEINGKTYQIESDYRAVLDILAALSDKDLTEEERTIAALEIFYPDFDDIPFSDYEEALRKCFRFIDHEQDQKEQKKQPTLMSWEQDFEMIVAPINRIAGCEIRALEYLHWYTFFVLLSGNWGLPVRPCGKYPGQESSRKASGQAGTRVLQAKP